MPNINITGIILTRTKTGVKLFFYHMAVCLCRIVTTRLEIIISIAIVLSFLTGRGKFLDLVFKFENEA